MLRRILIKDSRSYDVAGRMLHERRLPARTPRQLTQSLAQHVLVWPPSCAASGEFAVYHYGRQTPDSMVLCMSGNLVLMHVVNVEFLLLACYFLHEVNRLLAGCAPGAEDFNFVFLSHDFVS